jgi:hypothetical protein
MANEKKTAGESQGPITAAAILLKHFAGAPRETLVSTNRTFPATARVDLQRALDATFRNGKARLLGLHAPYAHQTLTIAQILSLGHYPVVIAPLEHEEVDLGEPAPALCLKQGLWLGRSKGVSFACLLGKASEYGRSTGMHLEIAVPGGAQGAKFASEFLVSIQKRVQEAASYRGKVISLEMMASFSGQAGNIRVHKLAPVPRENVILPRSTLELLERNVTGFARQRAGLKRLGLSAKKGILFYGPPGTGKTYTIRYLASQMPEHTTLLITAEHVGYLDWYFQLARHLQPAILVIEDVDLIGRAREEMESACEESMLNKLLNEMDGLAEDADVFFVLTTNRPEQLESALASRPGRIDQAIEFPLPDEEGRRQLIRLYSRGLKLTDRLINSLAKRTGGVSAAFIKELMRRSAQYHLQAGRRGELAEGDAVEAIEEMLFAGGSLNRKLLGAVGEIDGASPQD